MCRGRRIIGIALLVAVLAWRAGAHPMVQNALDVVIAPDRVLIDARVAMEELELVEAGGKTVTAERRADLARAHA